MPVFSRKQLRRDLAQSFVYDLATSRINNQGVASLGPFTQGGWGVAGVTDVKPEASGQDLFQGTWLYVEPSVNISDTSGTFYQYTIASFNCGSGAFFTQNPPYDYVNQGSFYEVHTKVPPSAKHVAIDDTLKRIRFRQEVGINTVDGALVYTIEGAASPNYLEQILDVHLMANPNNSLDLDLRHMQDWQVVTTATGRELRLKWGVKGSQQIVFDAILIPSLGGGEDATINLPDERWILAGAAMRCYDFMIQSAPGQQVNQLMQRRAEWAAEYTRLSAKFMPTYEEPIRLHDVIRGMTPRPWDSASNFW